MFESYRIGTFNGQRSARVQLVYYKYEEYERNRIHQRKNIEWRGEIKYTSLVYIIINL